MIDGGSRRAQIVFHYYRPCLCDDGSLHEHDCLTTRIAMQQALPYQAFVSSLIEKVPSVVSVYDCRGKSLTQKPTVKVELVDAFLCDSGLYISPKNHALPSPIR